MNRSLRLLALFYLASVCLSAFTGIAVFVGCQSPEESFPVIPETSSGTTLDAGDDSVPSDQVVATDDVLGDQPQATVKLASYEELQDLLKQQVGHPVIVDVWSTSCIPCMREFPHLVQLSEKYQGQLRCISLNVDYIGLKKKGPESYVPAVQEFLSQQNATQVINLASSDADRKILKALEVGAMPAILIFDAQGELVERFTDSNTGDDGLTYEGDIIPVVERLLASE